MHVHVYACGIFPEQKSMVLYMFARLGCTPLHRILLFLAKKQRGVRRLSRGKQCLVSGLVGP